MNRRHPIKLFLDLLGSVTLCCGLLAGAAETDALATDARRLLRRLDQTQVEELWPAGVHVSWETGQPDGRPERTKGKHTHCSAFVAATAKSLGVYLLRPPDHGQALLANAQYDWLSDQGQAHGWQEIQGGQRAQEQANCGYLVVAAYRNHHDDKPGHIAIVRPSGRSSRDIQADGPQITQAGGTNYLSTTVRNGFAGHPRAWAHHEIRYFAHAIDWAQIPSPQ